jgi:CHAT domain-containing protein/Tfp pilus assembly protein PilF
MTLMKLHTLLAVSSVALFLTASSNFAADLGTSQEDTPKLLPGVVVEAVTNGLEAAKAGIRQGDVILSWSRGDRRGDLNSPFDMSFVEVEESPRGPVALEGLRRTEKQVWTMGPDEWGVTTRPNFSDTILTWYSDGRQLAGTDKVADKLLAAEHWTALARRLLDSHPSWLSSWLFFHAAELMRDGKQWKQADDDYELAGQTASQGSPVIQFQISQSWARAFHQRNDWPHIEKYYQQSLAESRKPGSGELATASILHAWGLLLDKRGDLSRAEQAYLEALEIRQKLAPQSLATARTLNNLGLLATARGEMEKAASYLERALEIRRRLAPRSPAVVGSLNNLGALAWRQGDLERGEEYCRQALQIGMEINPEGPFLAPVYSTMALLAYDRGNLTQSEEYQEHVLQMLPQGSLDAAKTLGDIGVVAFERGNLAEADKYYREALDIEEKLAPGSLEVAGTLTNMGLVEQIRGDLERANQYLLEAVSINDKLAPESLDAASNYCNLGWNELDLGNLSEAERYFQKALRIQLKSAPEGMDPTVSYQGLADIAGQRGDSTRARAYYQKALAIQEKLAPEGIDLARTLMDMGDLVRESGDLPAAEQYYRRALAIRTKRDPESSEHAESLAAVASILRDQRQFDASAQFYAQALGALEKQTTRLGGSEDVRTGFRAKHSEIYRDYVELLLTLKQPERAFEVLERSRARSLLEVLAAAHIDIHKGADPSLLEEERSLRQSLTAKSDRRLRLLGEKNNEKQIAAFDKEIEDLNKQFQQLEERMRASSPDYAALTQPHPLTTGDIQQLLDDETVLLEYTLGKEHSHVFALTSVSVNVFELPQRAEIEKAARSVYDRVTERNTRPRGKTPSQVQVHRTPAAAAYAEASRTLSEMVMSPVARQIEGKRLLIVSDGALQYIPFAVLPAPQSRAEGTVSLVVNHEIVNLPSASTLGVLRRQAANRKTASKSVIVMADPVFDLQDGRLRRSPQTTAHVDSGGGLGRSSLERSGRDVRVSKNGIFPRLPFTRREADAISTIAAPGDAVQELDFDASKATAMSRKLSDYRIVHLATHGLLNSEHPELSGLVFSLVDRRGHKQDGFLRLADIYDLDLNADLVVLSACQTALGKQVDGEGLIGLARGFMYAGSPRVIASLWNVDDKATAELMAKFYEAMLKNHQTPAQALRFAQTWMQKQKRWESPRSWAGFVLLGEWK